MCKTQASETRRHQRCRIKKGSLHTTPIMIPNSYPPSIDNSKVYLAIGNESNVEAYANKPRVNVTITAYKANVRRYGSAPDVVETVVLPTDRC